MKVTLQDLLSAREPLAKLSAAKMPALSAYRIARLIARLNPEFQSAETGRLALYREFGTEKDGQIIVAPERMAEFLPMVERYVATEVVLDIQPLPFEAVQPATDLTPADFLALGPFIEEPK